MWPEGHEVGTKHKAKVEIESERNVPGLKWIGEGLGLLRHLVPPNERRGKASR